MLNINFKPFPELITARLCLRQMTIDDAKDFFAIRSNQTIMARLDKKVAGSIEEVILLLKKIECAIESNSGINWALCLKENNKQIGIVGFHNIYIENHRAEIGYTLLPDFHRKGLMKEAVNALIHYGFNQLKFHSIEAKVNPVNQASINLLKGFGFVKEAHFKQNFYFNGDFLDTAIYSLLADSYAKAK